MTRTMRTMTATLSLVLGATAVSAQEVEISPFRPGQWGTDISVSSGFSGIGALRFTSPTRAWILDVLVNLDMSKGVYSDTLRQFVNRHNSGAIRWRLGRRGYRRIGTGIYRTVTGGLTGQFSGQASNNSGAPRDYSFGAGLFGRIGAQWMVTPHLSLGAQWGPDVLYHWRRSKSGAESGTFTSIAFSLNAVELRGALYF